MATLEQKQELIDVLKFTPRTYKISMWGYGGEKVMGTVDRAAWDYCMANQVDLSDIAWNSEAHVDMDLDADQLPFQPGSWYECDNMGHTNGVSRDAGTVQIEDENGETVYEHELGEFDYDQPCPDMCCDDELWIGSRKKGEIVFVGSSNEKGTFFEGDIELTAPFDITKLEIHYEEFDGEEIVNAVYYDGEEIDNFGGSTDGKSSDFTMVEIIDDDGNFERYEPEEKDWGTPECGTSPDTWEKSVEFKFKKHKPVHVGWYNCVWGNYGRTYGCLYWDGKEFGEFEYGKFKPQSSVDVWSGYDWDTSSWDNRPVEPLELICDNPECGEACYSRDRVTDAEYIDHCFHCGGTEFTWIDYDPNTKEGQANRKKYLLTEDKWFSASKDDPVFADFESLMNGEPTELEKAELLAGLDAALEELAEESGIDFDNESTVPDDENKTTLPKGSWPF